MTTHQITPVITGVLDLLPRGGEISVAQLRTVVKIINQEPNKGTSDNGVIIQRLIRVCNKWPEYYRLNVSPRGAVLGATRLR